MTSDRSAALGRLVAPPGPATPAARATWDSLDDRGRATMRRAATDPDLATALGDPAHRAVVRELAVARAAGRAADVLVPVVTSLFVLSTVWGFGRAVAPATADAWLVAGLVGLVATLVVGRRRVRARRQEAARVLRALDEQPQRPTAPDA